MAFNRKLLEVIACPVCKGELQLANFGDKEKLVCRFDKLAYPIKENIPVLLETESRSLSLDELELIKANKG